MINVQTFQDWARTLNPKNEIVIDDGGLTLVEVDTKGNPTGAYFEVGGFPSDEDFDSENT